jgi:hypothetical protein
MKENFLESFAKVHKTHIFDILQQSLQHYVTEQDTLLQKSAEITEWQLQWEVEHAEFIYSQLMSGECGSVWLQYLLPSIGLEYSETHLPTFERVRTAIHSKRNKRLAAFLEHINQPVVEEPLEPALEALYEKWDSYDPDDDFYRVRRSPSCHVTYSIPLYCFGGK